jgi:MFS family permease
MLLAVLTIISNAILVFFSGLAWVLLAVIIANVGAGGSAGGGSGGGPFNPVEEALLAEKCSPENRNQIFAVNAFVGSVLGSLGALAAGLPQYLQEAWAWETVASYKPLFVLTIFFSIVLFFVYRSITEEHRPRKVEEKISRTTGVFVTKMSLLAFVDNFGAGLAGALLPYWFFLRYGVELKSLGMLFFVSYLLAALSFLSAPIIARRLGVVRTMAFSHGLASLIYFFIPLAPTFIIAAAMLAIRSYFAYMDNPLRASFTMAMVKSSERGSAAGVTNLARVVPFGISPTISTYLMQSVSLTLPLFIGGGLQLLNDIAFYLMFRHVRPPEEMDAPAAQRSSA